MTFDIWADPKPWMTEGLVNWLETNIRSTDCVLEFGGGASTMWWAKKAAFTYTLEAAPGWAPELIQRMSTRPDLLAKWSMGFVPCEWHTSVDQAKQYWTKHRDQITGEQADFLKDVYIQIPNWLRPDVIVIDGSVRPQCCFATAEYIRTHDHVRLIVVDNMEAMARHARDAFDGYDELPFHEYDLSKIPEHQNGKWCSSAFIKR